MFAQKAVRWLVLVIVLLAFAPASLASTNTVSGSIDLTDPTFHRMNFNCMTPSNFANHVHYDVIPFDVSVTDTYRIEVTQFRNSDSYIFVYQGAFDPNNPRLNCISGDDDSGHGLLSELHIPLTAFTSYYLVITTFHNLNDNANYTIEFEGDGTLCANDCFISKWRSDTAQGCVMTYRVAVAGTPDNTYCRILMFNGEVIDFAGSVPANLMDLGVIFAVDVYRLNGGQSISIFPDYARICLAGGGRLFYLDARNAPRYPIEMPTESLDGSTCVWIPAPGTLVLTR